MTTYTVISENDQTGETKTTTVENAETIVGAINIVAGTIYNGMRFSGWGVNVTKTLLANPDAEFTGWDVI